MKPARGPHRDVPPTHSPSAGDTNPEYVRIGRYRILKLLGRGGMGTVYLAQQTEPRRQVALKVIKKGMDTEQVLARFASEREALALMNHPNIARLLDAGVSDEGQPYFVMEHVPGIRITDYCDDHRLNNRERLEIFAAVCDAVHHAHQKGIIHRDLKPSNVLVAVQDGDPVPKVIDFGVAKATNQRLTDVTVMTEYGQRIGTPDYMSPELASMTDESVDTTTDVYSLGVMLYQLLAGSLPFAADDPSDVGHVGIQLKILTQDPPSPSARLNDQGDTATDVAQRRQVNVDGLRRQLRGELDWIVMRAMEKDRTKRYSSAAEFASDIRRYLNNEPVLARPPSAAYQLRKMVSRHSVAATAIGMVLLLTLGFGIWMSLLYSRAQRAERTAATQAAQAQQVTEFMKGLFATADPFEPAARTLTAKEMLDEGAKRLHNELQQQPELQATLMATIGDVYVSLGELEDAGPLLEQALQIQQRTVGKDQVETAGTLQLLGELHYEQGDLSRAESRLREALTNMQRSLGPEHEDIASTLSLLGRALGDKGDHEAAEELVREALAMRRRLLGAKHESVAESLHQLAWGLHMHRGNNEEAERLLREAMAIYREAQGKDSLQFVGMQKALAALLLNTGRLEEAQPILRRALFVAQENFDADHRNVIDALNDLAELLNLTGQYEESESMFRMALERARSKYGPSHFGTLMVTRNTALLLNRAGRLEEAEKMSRQGAALAMQSLGEDHPMHGNILLEQGRAMTRLNDAPAAEPILRRAVNILESLGEDHRYVGSARDGLGECLTALGRFPEAETQLLASHATQSKARGDTHPLTRDVRERLVVLYESWGKQQEAAAYRRLLDDTPNYIDGQPTEPGRTKP